MPSLTRILRSFAELAGLCAVSQGGTGAASAAGARTNLGLGSAATAASTDFASSTDPRLSDARTPTAHSASHRHGGSDEVAVATPTVNSIPKAGTDGKLASGWLPDLSGTYQPRDTDLDVVGGLIATGFVERTGPGAWNARTLTQADVPSLTSAKITDFAAAADARADGRITVQKGSANGLATLGSDSKVPSAQLPAIAITDTFVANSQAAMLALAAQTGDVCVRTDLHRSYILQGTDSTVLGNWQELQTPVDAVLSVNGLTGTVTLTTTNIAEGANLYYTDPRVDSRITAAVSAGTVLAPTGSGANLTGIIQAQVSGVRTSDSPSFAGVTTTGRATLAGIDGGFSGYTANLNTYTTGLWEPRWPDLAYGWKRDQQDVLAYKDKVATLLTITSGAMQFYDNPAVLFHDDAATVIYPSGAAISAIVLELDISSAPFVPSGNAYVALGLTFRNVPAPITGLNVELWDDGTAAYAMSYSFTGSITTTAPVFPQFLTPAGSNYSVKKVRLTIHTANPLSQDIYIQRVILYSPVAPWDPWHLHIGGGALYGAVTLGGFTLRADGSIAPATLAAASVTAGSLFVDSADGRISYKRSDGVTIDKL